MLQASGQGPGSSPLPCRATELVDLSAKVTSAGEPAAPSDVMCKGLVTVLCSKPKPHNPGTSPPLVVPIISREPESQAYQQLLHSRTLFEAQCAAGTCNTHQLAPCQVSQQKKPRVTDDQIMTHLRAYPKMTMSKSRILLGIGHRRYVKAKAKLKVPSTDDNIRCFHMSNPTATH